MRRNKRCWPATLNGHCEFFFLLLNVVSYSAVRMFTVTQRQRLSHPMTIMTMIKFIHPQWMGPAKEEANEDKKRPWQKREQIVNYLETHTQWEAAPNTQQIDDTNLTANDHFAVEDVFTFIKLAKKKLKTSRQLKYRNFLIKKINSNNM